LLGYLYGDLQSLHIFAAIGRSNPLEEESLASESYGGEGVAIFIREHQRGLAPVTGDPATG